MAVDGDIKLSVDLEPGDVASAANELQERIKAIFENSAGTKTSAQLDNLLIKIKALYGPFQQLKEQEEAIRGSVFIPEGLEELSNDIVELNAGFQRLKKGAFEMRAIIDSFRQRHSIPVEATVAYRNLRDNISALGEQYNKLSAEAEQYKNQIAQAEQVQSTLSQKRNLTFAEASEFIKAGDAIAEASGKLAEYDTKLDDLNKKAETLAGKLQNIKKSSPDSVMPARYQAELNEHIATYEKLKQSMFSNREAMREVRAAANQLRQEITRGEETEKYKEVVKELDEVINKLSVATKKVDELNDGANNTANSFGRTKRSVVDMFNNFKSIPNEIENFLDGFAKQFEAKFGPIVGLIYSLVKAAIKYIINEFIATLKQLASVAKQVIKQVANTIKTVLVKAINGAVTAVKTLTKALAVLASQIILRPFQKLGESIGNIRKNAQESTPSLKQLGRMFLQYGIGARSLYRLINKLRTALFEGFADLSLAYEPFNEAMSRIMTALEYLKNSFAAAFAPIIEYVAPVLSIFVTKVAEAVQWVGQLIAALTGKEFVMAMPVWKDYAQSTSAGAAAAKEQANADKNAAKAANDAAKAEAKRNKQLEKYKKTIAGFDDVELLKVPDENESTTDGTGTSPKDYDFSTPTLDAALQKFKVGGPIQDGIKKFADLIKKAWKTADAYDLGKLFNKQLQELLKQFYHTLPKIQEFFGKVARVVASFLAGFLSIPETFKWLGLAIAGVINTIFKTIQEFLKTFMSYDGFKNLGKAIYNTIVVALANINWETIYDVFRMMGIGIAQVLNETIAKPEFWKQIFTALTNALRAVLIRIIAFSHTLHWADIGKAIAAGINTGIENFPVSELVEAIHSFFWGLWYTFMNVLHDTQWSELGHTIADIIVGVFAYFSPEEFASGIMLFFDSLLKAFTALIGDIPWGDVGTGIANFVIAMIENFPTEDAIIAISTFLDGLWTAFMNFVNGMQGHWEEVGHTAATLIIGLFDNFNPEEFANGVIAFLDGLWDAFMGFVETPEWDKVVDKIKDAIIYFAEHFEWKGKVDGLVTFLNNAIDALIDILDKLDIPKFLDELYAELKESEEFEEFCGKVIDLIIYWLKLKIKAKLFFFKGIGDSIVQHMTGGEIDSMAELAKQAAEAQYDATNGAVGKYKKDYENIGADSISDPVATGMESKKSELVNTAGNLNDAVINKLGSGDYNGTATNNMSNYNLGIDSQKSTIHGTISEIQNDSLDTLNSGDYKLIGGNKLSEYHAGMEGIRPTIQGSVKMVSDDVQTTLSSGDFSSISSNQLSDYESGFNGDTTQLESTVSNISNNVYDTFNSNNWSDLGGNILAGISEGMDNGWEDLAGKAWNLAVDLYNTACEALGIASPSKVFRDKIGEMIPAGIGVGIEANADSALGAVDDLSNGLVDTAKNIKIPPIAMGEVIPYNIATNQDSTQTALNTLADMIQSLQSSMVTEETLDRAIANVIANMPDFYIGQEKLARIVRQGNSMLDRRYGY